MSEVGRRGVDKPGKRGSFDPFSLGVFGSRPPAVSRSRRVTISRLVFPLIRTPLKDLWRLVGNALFSVYCRRRYTVAGRISQEDRTQALRLENVEIVVIACNVECLPEFLEFRPISGELVQCRFMTQFKTIPRSIGLVSLLVLY